MALKTLHATQQNGCVPHALWVEARIALAIDWMLLMAASSAVMLTKACTGF
jgi:hypothetical protein